MSKQTKRGRGRPNKFSPAIVRVLKAVVRKNGLLKGHVILNANPIEVKQFGKTESVQISVSLPTLSKYVRNGDHPVALKRGRPVVKKTAEKVAA